MLLETTVIVDFKWPSVKRDRLSTLLLFRRGKKHTHAEVLLNITVIHTCTYISYNFGRSIESVIKKTVRHEICQRKLTNTPANRI
jgi:hypothetical protein